MSSFGWKKKHWRFYQGWIDHSSHHERNILRTKDGKCKTTKGIPGCHGYHEMCWWNSGWYLVKDYAVYKKWTNEWYNKTFYGPLKGNKITWHNLLRRKMAQTKGKDCLPLGQRHFSHICHTNLGQSTALYNVRQPVITTRIHVLHKITIALEFMSYINSNLPIPADKLQIPGLRQCTKWTTAWKRVGSWQCDEGDQFKFKSIQIGKE